MATASGTFPSPPLEMRRLRVMIVIVKVCVPGSAAVDLRWTLPGNGSSYPAV